MNRAISNPKSTSTNNCHRRQRGALTLALGFACLFASPIALAEERKNSDDGSIGRTHIAVDFDYAAAMGDNDVESGTGGAIRVGRELDLMLVTLTPELGGTYETFTGSPNSRVYGGFAGGRLGVGKIIEPSIFAHVGVAHIDGWQDRTAPMLDAGLALDFTLLPLIDLGVHAGINTLLATREGNGVTWATAGLQAALVF